LSIIGVFLILFSWTKILLLLHDEIWQKGLVIILLFWSVAFTPFKYLSNTDALSFGLYSLALFYVFRNIIGDVKIKWTHVFLISLFSYLPSLFRYAYYPFSLFAPFFLLAFWFVKTRRLSLKTISPFLLTGVLVFTQLIGLKAIFGSANNMSARSEGSMIYFNHLIHFDSVFFNSFFSDSFLYYYFGFDYRMPNPSIALYIFLLVGSLFIVALCTWLIVKYINRFKSDLNKKKSSVLFTFLILTIMMNLGFIGLLSIVYPSQASTYVWTLLMNSRYFVLSFLAVQLLIFIPLLIDRKEPFIDSRLLKVGTMSLILASFLFGSSQFVKNTFFDSYSLTNARINLNKDLPYDDFIAFKDLVATKGNSPVLLIPTMQTSIPSHHKWFQYFGTMGGARLFSEDNSAFSKLSTSADVEVLIPVFHNNDSKGIDHLISTYECRKEREFHALNMTLYSTIIKENNQKQ